MARGLARVMRRADAVRVFEEETMPLLRLLYEQDGVPDMPVRCEAWNNWTDSLCKSRKISDWQYANWSHPPSCEED